MTYTLTKRPWRGDKGFLSRMEADVQEWANANGLLDTGYGTDAAKDAVANYIENEWGASRVLYQIGVRSMSFTPEWDLYPTWRTEWPSA